MNDPEPLARMEYESGKVGDVLEFLKRTRGELRSLRLVRVWPDRVRVVDVNGDSFEVAGLGYRDRDITTVLDNVNTNYKPEFIHDEISGPYKEFKAGRRYPWAADRVM